MLNKQKRTICVFKFWLNFQLASFEALLSLEKPINDPTQSWSAVPFFASCRTKRYPSKLGIYSVFSYHIGQACPVKEFWWSRNGAFFENKKKSRDAHPMGSAVTRRWEVYLHAVAARARRPLCVVNRWAHNKRRGKELSPVRVNRTTNLETRSKQRPAAFGSQSDTNLR